MAGNPDVGTPSASARAAFEAQRAVMRALRRLNMPDWMHLDLSMGQLKALVALTTAGSINVSGLADQLEVGNPAASILVDRLVQLGYAQRTEDPDDRRRTLVTPTARGSDLAARLQQAGGERLLRWMEQMTPDDLAALTRGLSALAAIASRETGETGQTGQTGGRDDSAAPPAPSTALHTETIETVED